MQSATHPHRILIVDDEERNIRVLERMLRRAGYEHTRAVSDARRVLTAFKDFSPDILLLDLRMPHLDGFAIMDQIVARTPDTVYLPILVITGDVSSRVKQKALAGGATDFLTKPFDPVEVILRVKNLLKTRDLHTHLEDRVRERTEELRVAQIEVAERLALASEFRDYSGGGHTQRVGRICALIGRALGLDDQEVETIRRAAPLHDIGKIAIPDAILLKSGPLSPDEMDVMRTHTSLGARMLSGSSSRVLQVGEEIALYHHENWDGTGYTPGLAGESIPLAGRIATVADVWDALVHERPYKHRWEPEDAVSWIREQQGKKFDPDVVDVFAGIQAKQKLPRLDDGDNDWARVTGPNGAASGEHDRKGDGVL